MSKVVGEKLTRDNPNITDLNDQNRPTKLGEMYGELYDNEWSDAFEALTETGHSGNESIATLRQTLLVRTIYFHNLKNRTENDSDSFSVSLQKRVFYPDGVF